MNSKKSIFEKQLQSSLPSMKVAVSGGVQKIDRARSSVPESLSPGDNRDPEQVDRLDEPGILIEAVSLDLLDELEGVEIDLG